MRHQAIGTQEILSLVKTSLSDSLKSPEGQKALAALFEGSLGSNEQAVSTAAAQIGNATVFRIRESVLRVDISEFELSGENPTPELVFKFNPKEKAFSLLSAVYFQISNFVPAYSYGKAWALRDIESKQLIMPRGVNWSDRDALAQSDATVEQLGLRAGLRLRATRIGDGSR